MSHSTPSSEHTTATATTLEQEAPIQIGVAYNCLLIPVVMAVWWYWTCKTARQLRRRWGALCAARSDDESSTFAAADAAYTHYNDDDDDDDDVVSVVGFAGTRNDNDPFTSWDDVVGTTEVVEPSSSFSSSPMSRQRWVRWIRLGSSDNNNVTMRHCCHTTTSNVPFGSNNQSNHETAAADPQTHSTTATMTSWQCIEDMTVTTTAASMVELCDLTKLSSAFC